MRSIYARAALAAAFVSILADVASAHPSVSSGPAQATKSQKITFGLSHGCDGDDTISLRVQIPTGISSVRALPSGTFKPTIEGAANAVTAVVWSKPVVDLHDSDFGYYEFTIRARVADVPFSKIYFRINQTCRGMDGTITNVDWVALPGETGEPAAGLTVVPARVSGWNKYLLTAPVVAADVPAYFADAQIVWRGMSAYSPNSSTMTLIGATPGVSALSGDLAATQEIWVKY